MGSVSKLGYLGDRTGKKGKPFPKGVLLGAIGFLVFAAGAIVFGQTTGIGVVKTKLGEPIAMRDIVLNREANDIVTVTDANSGERIVAYEANSGGFVRGSLRAFERMRMVSKVPLAQPYRLIKWQAGMITLSDTATGERIYLDPFGKDNAGAFEALLGKYGEPAAERSDLGKSAGEEKLREQKG